MSEENCWTCNPGMWGCSGHNVRGWGWGWWKTDPVKKHTCFASPFSALIIVHFSSTLKLPICHHPLKVFVSNCKILRPMHFGTNIAINIDIPCKANIILIMLLAGSLESSCSPLFWALALPCSLFLRIFSSYWLHNKREQEIKPGLYSYVLEPSFSKLNSRIAFVFNQDRARHIFDLSFIPWTFTEHCCFPGWH